MAKIYHPEIFVLREKKYSWLEKHNSSNTKWKDIKPQSEFYLFIPQDVKLLKQYQSYKRITEIFPVNSVGVVTSRDDFVIDFEKNLKHRCRARENETNKIVINCNTRKNGHIITNSIVAHHITVA